MKDPSLIPWQKTIDRLTKLDVEANLADLDRMAVDAHCIHVIGGLLWQCIGFNRQLLILPPEDDDYVRPKYLKPTRLSFAIEVVLA